MSSMEQEPEWVPDSALPGNDNDGNDNRRKASMFNQKELGTQFNWVGLKRDLLKAMKDDAWDDGSYGPILIRLAWHSSGTYDAVSGTGGTYNGATMRFKTEANDPENAGLRAARDFLEPIKAKYPEVSYADLWVFAAYTFIENSGGPTIPFTPGRVDATSKDGPKKAVKPGRLPGAEHGLAPIRGGRAAWLDEENRVKGWENLAQHLRDVFGRMWITDQEVVALLCGGHVYGRCHPGSSGYAGPWVAEMTEFSNEYAADMIEDDWICVTHEDDWLDAVGAGQVRPAKGKRQYVNVAKPPLKAPSPAGFPTGKYKLTGDKWCNLRKEPNTKSATIARPEEEAEMNIVGIKTFGTAVRGTLDCGGWVSIVATGGTVLWERVGDLEFTIGQYRAVGAQTIYSAPRADAETSKTISGEFEIPLPPPNEDGEAQPPEAAFTVHEGNTFAQIPGGYVMTYSNKVGVTCQRIIEGINDTTEERQFEDFVAVPQMMLVSDMVLVWDAGFRMHLEKYAEDEALLKKDFGVAFKKLTELGQTVDMVGCPVAH